MSDMWSILTPEEKRLVTDNFTIHSFKKNQIVYREGDEPEYLWILLKGKIKNSRTVWAVDSRLYGCCGRCSILATGHILPELPTCRAHVPSNRP